jgi:hypothetical protein
LFEKVSVDIDFICSVIGINIVTDKSGHCKWDQFVHLSGEMSSARLWILNASHDKFRDNIFPKHMHTGQWELWVHTRWLDHLDHIGVTEHGTDACGIQLVRKYSSAPYTDTHLPTKM